MSAKTWIELGIIAVIAVVFVSLLVGLVTDKSIRDTATITNGTTCTYLNLTTSCARNYGLSDPYETAGSLSLTTQGINATHNITVQDAGTVLCTLNSTSPYICAIPYAYMTGSSLHLSYNSTFTNTAITTSTNATTCENLNSTTSCERNFALLSPYTANATLTLTTQGVNDTQNVTVQYGDIVLCTLNDTSPFPCVVGAGSMFGTNLALTYNSSYNSGGNDSFVNITTATLTYTQTTNTVANITTATLTYTQEAASDDWNPASAVLWIIVLPICLVAGAVIIISRF